jgi:hypothetical protein
MVSDEVVNTACPDAFSVPVPTLVFPSKNVTVPVGTPPAPETVAVKLTACPNADGLSEEASVVVVAARFTVCVNTGEVLAAKFKLPPYTAVIVCAPTERAAVPKLAWPEAFSVAVPSEVAPSLNVTRPIGTPLLELTVAVKATDWPNVDGLSAEMSAVVVGETTFATLYVTLDEPVFPALSVAATVNVLVPVNEVSIGLPFATGPWHVATPEPLSAHAYDALTLAFNW